MKKYQLVALTIVLLTASFSEAGVRCYSLFSSTRPYQYQAKAYEVEQLYKAYPKFRETINTMTDAILSVAITKTPISRIEQIQEQGSLRSYSANDATNPENLKTIDPNLQKQIIEAYNLLLNRDEFSKYLKQLVLDSAVLMMKTKNQSTYKVADINNPLSEKLQEKTTRDEFLKAGRIDHHSLVKVLVDRIKSRGDRVSIIPSVGYTNRTKTMNFDTFYKVPRHGPFFDNVFPVGSSHGQEGHLLQMDYVERALTDREQFWNYTTKIERGDWVWDTLFDGMNSTIMHPEFIGPIIRQHIPIY